MIKPIGVHDTMTSGPARPTPSLSAGLADPIRLDPLRRQRPETPRGPGGASGSSAAVVDLATAHSRAGRKAAPAHRSAGPFNGPDNLGGASQAKSQRGPVTSIAVSSTAMT